MQSKSIHHSYQRVEVFRRLLARVTTLRRKIHFYARRIFSKSQHFSAGYHTTGPISYLVTSLMIGLALVLSSLYSTGYTVSIDGTRMAVVDQLEVVLSAIDEVEDQGSVILNREYTIPNKVEYQFGLTLKSELSDSGEIAHYLYSQLDDLGSALQRFLVEVDGKSIGILLDMETVDSVLDKITSFYSTENTVSADFVEDLTITKVYSGAFIAEDALFEALTENTTGETTYTVASGDTFNAVAYINDMSTAELRLLNPDFDPDRLFIGDVLNVKKVIPLLSVVTVDQEQYLAPIECPVVDVDDNTVYIGSTKIHSYGVEGEADILASVTYENGFEVEREILSSVTLREPTETIRGVGTLERPVTASYGSFVWPARGTITSYFGGRTLYGRYDFHSGLDIAAPTGTPIYAADGGTVTFSGWKTGYGNIVIITHDNGTQTYYAHNSSNAVSSGQKVYRGQYIAAMGSTGNSTGSHLHFEVRIGGQSVNPLGYL
ncbi:MAG: M23 family metallopeptidase [Eubacteriales bacterium]